MIYVISDQQELVVETDNLEYAKKVLKAHPDCSIRELGTGKVYRGRPAAAAAGPLGQPAAGEAASTIPRSA